MYERLTERNANGTAKSRMSATCREDAWQNEADILDRLCDLEDKIEQGKILELPCAVGEYVYRIIGENTPKPWIWHWEIVEIMIYPDEIVYRDDSDNIIENKDFGKTVFLTREEAEKALAERKEE